MSTQLRRLTQLRQRNCDKQTKMLSTKQFTASRMSTTVPQVQAEVDPELVSRLELPTHS